MTTVNIHEAKTHLSRLLAGVVRGEEFIIAKAGKPLAKVVPFEDPQTEKTSRFGFLKNAGLKVPDNFDELGREEIEVMFYGKP